MVCLRAITLFSAIWSEACVWIAPLVSLGGLQGSRNGKPEYLGMFPPVY